MQAMATRQAGGPAALTRRSRAAPLPGVRRAAAVRRTCSGGRLVVAPIRAALGNVHPGQVSRRAQRRLDASGGCSTSSRARIAPWAGVKASRGRDSERGLSGERSRTLCSLSPLFAPPTKHASALSASALCPFAPPRRACARSRRRSLLPVRARPQPLNATKSSHDPATQRNPGGATRATAALTIPSPQNSTAQRQQQQQQQQQQQRQRQLLLVARRRQQRLDPRRLPLRP